MGIFILESSTQVNFELHLLFERTLVRIQMRKSLVQLTHENGIVSFTEIGVIVSTKLLVSVDHVANTAHHPLNRVHGTDSISITVHHSDRYVRDILDWNIGSNAMLFTLKIRLSILLEATFDSHLEEMSERSSRHWLLFPNNLLITPRFTQMSTNIWLELLPVEAM